MSGRVITTLLISHLYSGMFRRFSTSLRAAQGLTIEDWAALKSAFPSGTTMGSMFLDTTWMAFAISAVTGTIVVGTSDCLLRYRLAELEAKIDAKMMSLETKVEDLMGKLKSK
jgi:hypothetical protein